MSDSFTTKGFDEISANLRKQAEELQSRINEELLSFGNEVLNRSRNEFVPIDEGALRNDSGIDQDKNDLSITLWYGRNEAQDYAAAIHENPSEHDPPTWKGKQIQFTHGGSKFLERPLNDARGEFESRMAKVIIKE